MRAMPKFERNCPRRGGDWSLCSPEYVPAPERVRGPARLQYAGLVHELVKALVRMFQRDTSGINAMTCQQLAENLIRRQSVVVLILLVYRDRMTTTDEYKRLRARLMTLCSEADELFPGTLSPRRAGDPADRDVAARLHAAVSGHLIAAEELSTFGLHSPDRVDPNHLVQLLAKLRSATTAYVQLLDHLGFDRDARFIEALMARLVEEERESPRVPLPRLRAWRGADARV